MYRDLRIRNAFKPTPVPFNYKAYVFYAYALDVVVHKVIIAPNFTIAYARLKDFCVEQGCDLFWNLLAEDDFEVVHRCDTPPKLF